MILTLAFCCCCCWDIENGEYSFVERLDSLQSPALLGDFFEELMSLQTLARYFTSGRVQKLPILDHYSNGSSSYASDFLARLSSDDGLDLSKLKASDLNR